MLRSAGNTNSAQRLKHNGHFNFPVAHVKDVRRLIDDLRPCLESKTAGADGDDRVEACDRRADGHAAESQFRDGRAQNAGIEFVEQRFHIFRVKQSAESRATDNHHVFVRAHEIANRFDLGFAEHCFGHDELLRKD